jgi:hypothetical protein
LLLRFFQVCSWSYSFWFTFTFTFTWQQVLSCV